MMNPRFFYCIEPISTLEQAGIVVYMLLAQ
ncbi:hypothetical protein RED65_02158 [Oceanobacter sp. RED65]|uniref:Uncharacterized protein n=1 Tax=Bermanella marisrubri TaxID=207949 RepID=Q1MYF8_9GAMM|nr:hypothetical protein RED65_02158 [Oceanobacter sp. RED65] [Bermanella marisrubri]